MVSCVAVALMCLMSSMCELSPQVARTLGGMTSLLSEVVQVTVNSLFSGSSYFTAERFEGVHHGVINVNFIFLQFIFTFTGTRMPLVDANSFRLFTFFFCLGGIDVLQLKLFQALLIVDPLYCHSKNSNWGLLDKHPRNHFIAQARYNTTAWK